MKNIFIALLIFFSLVSLSHGATIYADNTLVSNCTSGNYSIAARDCSGSNGNAYTTIQGAVNSMVKGDTVEIRGGTYLETVTLPTAINGSAWTTGNYNTIASYPGEWAVLDGQNNTSGAVLGRVYSGGVPSHNDDDIKYWVIERLEIKNGRNSAGTNAAGFFGNGGPFWLRFLYVHDNNVTGADNAFGIGGNHWQDSIVEYCYFANNGCTGSGCGAADNASHIDIYSDYNWNTRASGGWNPASQSDSYGYAPYRNIIRYNHAVGTAEIKFFKHKAAQYFTRRVTGWQDTYNAYGDNIHHNVLVGPWRTGILCHQDFCQIYQNIIDGADTGISLNYEESSYVPLYKPVIYNNTIIGANTAIQFRGGASIYAEQLNDLYGYAYNNIIDSNTAAGYGEFSMRSNSLTVSNWYLNKNYSYRPVGSAIVRYWGSAHTASQFQDQTDTGSPHIYYYQEYNAGNLLYKGTSGADKYRIRSDHSITNTAGNTTAGAGGVGGSHPYLSGITIPSYLGAANPSDDAWVAGVLALDSTYFTSVTAGSTPTWVEGTTPTATGCTLSGVSMQ